MYKLKIYTLVLVVFVSSALHAELIQINLDGSRVPIYFDLNSGHMYVDGDCNPLLKFKEKKFSLKKKNDTREFAINRLKSRAAKKSLRPERLPHTIIIEGSQVKILSSGLSGNRYALGHIVFSPLQKRKKSTCK